jgi:hypothetical protein
MTNADVCRERGWGKGTVVRIEDETGEALFEITAVGEDSVLGKQLGSREFGFSWSKCSPGFPEQAIGFRLADATLSRVEVMDGK